MLFELEYAKDEQKKKDKEEAVWGPPPLQKTKDEKVLVKHLENEHVPSIFEELSTLDVNRPEEKPKQEEDSTFSSVLRKEK